MFSLLIKRSGLIDPPDMGETDYHCHLLPRLDDGPLDDMGSLAIARLLVEKGIRRVVATPHILSDTYPNTSGDVIAAVDHLQQLLDTRSMNLKVFPGAEYYAEKELLRKIDQGDVLNFGPRKYVLFESPVDQTPLVFEEIIFNLKSSGYTPLLAHAERYRFIQDAPKGYIERLRKLGVAFQVNHPSFYLPATSRRGQMARLLYTRGLIDVLGTDMHRATPRMRRVHTPVSKSVSINRDGLQ